MFEGTAGGLNHIDAASCTKNTQWMLDAWKAHAIWVLMRDSEYFNEAPQLLDHPERMFTAGAGPRTHPIDYAPAFAERPAIGTPIDPVARRSDLHEYHGGCHCGNVHWTLRSGLAASELPVRACQCEFCRKHGALSTSDAQGEMNFTVLDRGTLIRYRFATKSAEFLVCARCGIYVGAQMEEDGRFYAIANLRAFDVNEEFARRAQQMDYSGENSNARRTRRARRWTPVALPA
jgi:hypothetical protein